MKRLTLFVVAAVISASAMAQVDINIQANAEKGFGPINTGAFSISSVSYQVAKNNNDHSSYRLTLSQRGKDFNYDTANMPNKMSLAPVAESLEDYFILRNVCSLGALSKLNNLYSTRAEIEEDANSFVGNMERYGMIFDDPYLESYLYSIVSKIVPSKRADGFPYDIRILISRDDSMNACVYPNGTLVINTGLLAAIHTEDELVAVLAHEIGHYMANHSLCNIQKAEQRKARAEFWAAFATTMAAAAEIGAAHQGYYVNGSLTMGTALLSTAIAIDVIKRLGVDYSKEQEKDADEMAIKALSYLGYDTNACATLFQRMADVFNTEGNWAAYYLSGDHPSLQERIEYSGTPYEKVDPVFEKKISFAVTAAAITKFQMGRFSQAMKFVDQNINNGVATDDDLLIKALCLLNLYDTEDANKQAYDYVRQASEYNPDNKNIRRTEIIACSRMGLKSETVDLLTKYQNELNEDLATAEPDSYYYTYARNEYDWARKMLIKTRGL